MKKNRTDSLYRNPSFFMDREVSRIKKRDKAIEKLLRGVHSNLTLMDRETIKHQSKIQKLPRWIKKLSRLNLKNQDCNNNY